MFKQNNYNNNDFSYCNETNFMGINNIPLKGLTRIFKRIDFIKYQSNAWFIQTIDICKI
jgi:hypothetical protein